MGTRSEYENYVASLVSQGMDEGQARQAATKRYYLYNVAKAGLGGAVTGGVMAGGANIIGSIGNKNAQAPLKPVLPPIAGGEQQVQNGQKNTAEGAAYRSALPQNISEPTVPNIDISMSEISAINGGAMPTDGNHIRNKVVSRAEKRLGLDKHSAAFIPASNVVKNGEEYVLKVTKATLSKMLSPSDGGTVPIECAAIMEHLERIANNGVYFRSEGDRKNRPQVNGIDHLMTTVYIDNVPTLVDMRVRLIQQEKNGPEENVLYYFSPETITLTKRDGDTPAAERQAFRGEASPSLDPTLSQGQSDVNTEDMRNGGEDAAAYGKLAPLQVNSVDDAQNAAYNRRNGGVLDAGSEYGAENAGDRVPRVQMPVGEMAGRGTDGRGNPGISGLELGPESGTRETLDGQGVVNLGLQDSSSDSALFASALDAAKASNEHGAFVDS